MIAALAAVGIGVAAIVVSIMQVRIMREEQQASVWPRVVVATGYSPGEHLELTVHNAGIGPAVIRSVTVSVDDRPVAKWGDAFQAMIGEQRWRGAMASVKQGSILSPGETVAAFRLDNPPFIDRLAAALNRLRLDVCYCSVYDRCWIASTHDTMPEPRPVPRCTASRNEFR